MISMLDAKSRPKSEKFYAWKLLKTKIYDTIRRRTSIAFQTLAATQHTKSVTQALRVEYIFLTEKYTTTVIYVFRSEVIVVVSRLRTPGIWCWVVWWMEYTFRKKQHPSKRWKLYNTLQGIIFDKIVISDISSGVAGEGGVSGATHWIFCAQ